MPVILLEGEFGTGQQRDGLAQLVGAEAGQRIANQLAAVLPHAMFVKQRTQRRMGRLPLQVDQQQQLAL